MVNGAIVKTAERVHAVEVCYSSRAEAQKLSGAAVETAVALYRARIALTERYCQDALHELHPLHTSARPGHATDALDSITFPLASLLLAPAAPSGPLTLLRVLVMTNTDIELLDVRGMKSLELLDLSNNKLSVHHHRHRIAPAQCLKFLL